MKEARREYSRKWLKSPTRPRALCHPEKPHRARGLCDACYDRWLYAHSQKNRSTKIANNQKWRKANPQRARAADRNYKLRKKYGIGVEDFNQMYKAQGGKCAICGQGGISLHVDHNHQTKRIRALLCLACNGSLAFVEKNLRNDEWVTLATRYLEKYDAKENTKATG